MKANILLKLHERQSSICSMYIKCNKYLYSAEIDLMAADKSIWYPENLKWIRSQVEKYKAIKNRLTGYYLEVQKRIDSMHPIIELTETEASLQLQKHLS